MIEPIESRIAPAAVFPFTDVDGDLVTVKTSSGNDQQLADIINPNLVMSGLGFSLQRIDFSANAGVFSGTDLTITAKQVDGRGDGLVDVAVIDASNSDLTGDNLNLGNLRIAGNLGYIYAGTGGSDPAVKSLNLHSFLAPSGAYGSRLTGSLGSLVVAGDVYLADLSIAGDLGSVQIGGSLIGGAGGNSGKIDVTGSIRGPVLVKGSLVGGSGDESGSIQSSHDLGSVTVLGSLVGFVGTHSGSIRAGSVAGGAISSIKIGGDVAGASGIESGSIVTTGKIGKLSIGGSLLGGDDQNPTSTADSTVSGGRVVAGELVAVTIGKDIVGGSGNSGGGVAAGKIGSITVGGSVIGGIDPVRDGQVYAQETGFIRSSTGDIGSVKIGGDLRGNATNSGQITSAGKLGSLQISGSIIGGNTDSSGAVQVAGTLGKLTVGHDLRGGHAQQGETAFNSGSINAGRILSATFGGSIIGGIASGNGAVTAAGSIQTRFEIGSLTVKGNIIGPTQPVQIFAFGQEATTSTSDLAIGKLTIGGSVVNAQIAAGESGVSFNHNADAQIGTVKVGGDWISSSLSAGVDDQSDGLGDAGDAKYNVINATRDTALTSRIASITIGGQVRSTAGVYGFAAEEVVAMKVHGLAIPLTRGASNDTFAGAKVHALGPDRSATNSDGFAVHVFEV